MIKKIVSNLIQPKLEYAAVAWFPVSTLVETYNEVGKKAGNCKIQMSPDLRNLNFV